MESAFFNPSEAIHQALVYCGTHPYPDGQGISITHPATAMVCVRFLPLLRPGPHIRISFHWKHHAFFGEGQKKQLQRLMSTNGNDLWWIVPVYDANGVYGYRFELRFDYHYREALCPQQFSTDLQCNLFKIGANIMYMILPYLNEITQKESA
jgi:hypothetical protein